MVRSVASVLYECDRGHRFALTPSNVGSPVAREFWRGELDGSGESDNSQTATSGESGVMGRAAGPWNRFYTDSRRVTLIPRERPVFGDPG